MNSSKNLAAAVLLLAVIFVATAAASTEISARVDGVVLDPTAPNHVTLPATLVFSADEPVTIYYTTNGAEPTTSSHSHAIIASANGTATGPIITSTDYMLLTQGVDAGGSLTPLLVYTFVSP